MKPPLFLTVSLFCFAYPLVAEAAMTKAIVLGCREQSDLKTAAQLRVKGDKKASVDFETAKIAAGNCLLLPRSTAVSIDQRNAPLFCIRPPGSLDCYWTIGSAVDEYATGASQGGGSLPTAGKRRH
ncbi:MAG: hypothetical protein NVS2B5_03120 [Beijerinckiaceae bacterium]